MKKLMFVFLTLFLSVILLSACACNHQWTEATCAAPKTCTLCGETNGEALVHQWAEATCIAAKNCSLCGENDGDALEHQWVAATCTTPDTCIDCSTTQGDALGHIEGSPNYTNIDFNSATADYTLNCEICGELLDSGSGAMTSLHDGEKFICTSLQHFDRILKMHKEDDYKLGGFGDTDSEGGLFALIYWDTDFISRMVYKKADGTAATPEDTFSTLYLNLGWNLGLLDVLSENRHHIHSVPVMVACDPSLTHDEALELYNTLMADSELSLSHNGLAYKLYYDEESAALTMSVTVE